MKKLLILLSIGALGYSAIRVLNQHNQAIAFNPEQSATTEGGRGWFSDWAVGKTEPVEWSVDNATWEQFTERERKDQLRDWLLFTVASASGASADEINRCTFDLPAVRQGYLKHSGRFEYGSTRSAIFGDGDVLAIVPNGDPAAKADALARIADEARKNLGKVPKAFHVFAYELGSGLNATVTRDPVHKGAELFSDAWGYKEAKISAAADLARLLEGVDDVIEAKIAAGVLKVAGRKLKGGGYRNIAMEDVAALWQAERKIGEQQQAIEAEWADFKLKWKVREEAFNEEWKYKKVGTRTPPRSPAVDLLRNMNRDRERRGAAALPEFDFSEFDTLNTFKTTETRDQAFDRLQKEYDQEAEEFQKTLSKRLKAKGLVNGTGFSLDPSYDYKGLAQKLSSESVSAIFDGAKRAPIAPAIAALKAEEPDIVPLLELIEKYKESEDGAEGLLGLLLRRMEQDHRYQAARYDGDLQGTEVGMVLFYTDLLAKLWALNFKDTIPSKIIDDFQPMTRVPTSPVFREETRHLSSTRLWFGHEDNGFQVGSGDQILFARNAARIYAASSNPLQPGKEVAPNAESEEFLGWWNDHYEEVAAYEPEYQRLNEIMKWSLIIGWLNQNSRGDLLKSLADVTVNRANWFPDWVQANGALRFGKWQEIEFKPKSFLGTKTEAMPILSSDEYSKIGDVPGSVWTLSGGVSLASRDTFKARSLVSEAVPGAMRRSGVNYGKSGGPNELVTLRDVRFQFREAQRLASGQELSKVSVSVKDGSKLRARYGELGGKNFERAVFRDGANLEVRATASGTEIGAFKVRRNANGFAAGWKARGIEDGQAIGRRLSTSKDWQKSLVEDPSVEFAKLSANGKTAWVKTRGSDRWAKMEAEAKPSRDLAEGWDSRVADLKPDAQSVQIAWMTESKFASAVPNEGTWVRGPPPPPNRPPGPQTAAGSEPGDFNRAFKGMMDDPLAYKKAREAEVTATIDEVDALRKSGRSADALEKVDAAINTFGRRDDLLLRRALAEADAGRPIAAMDALGSSKNSSGLNKQTLEAVNREIAGLGQGPRAENLRRIGEAADWSGQLPPGERVVPTSLRGEVELRLELPEMPQGARVPNGGIQKGRDIYVEDKPALQNLDWATSPARAAESASGSNLADVIVLPRGDVAYYRPDTIIAGGRPFRRVGTSAPAPSGRPIAGRKWKYILVAGILTAVAADDDDDENEKNAAPPVANDQAAPPKEVYLVAAKPGR